MGSPRRHFSRMLLEKPSRDKREMTVMAAGGGAAGGGTSGGAVRVLTLHHGEHQDATLYRFEKGDTVQFCPGTSLLGRRVFLYTNYVQADDPEEECTAEFVRNQYHLLSWRRLVTSTAGEGEGEGQEEVVTSQEAGPGACLTDTEMYCELRLRRAGPFHYYFVYDDKQRAGAGPMGSGWWSVAPRCVVPPPALCCQTLVARCVGPRARWAAAAAAARAAGYNALHWTPLQARGRSDSAYCIRDHLALDPSLQATLADLQHFTDNLRTEHKMMSITDVVLNHTANETAWLAREPAATYNLGNTPRLRAAALLDAALARAARAVAAGQWVPRGVPARVTDEAHIQAVHHVLSTETVPALRLHELYTCDVPALLAEFQRRARDKLPPPPTAAPATAAPATAAAPELRLVQDPQYRRLQTKVDMDLALQLYNIYWAECYDEESRLRRCAEELRRRLEELNEAAAADVRAHLAAAVDNCRAGMRYFRVQADGPKIQEVSDKHPLVPRYFTWPEGALESAAGTEAAVYGALGALMQAHNGWVMDADPLQDFATHSHVYLRRELIAWGDSVKLRYGSGPEDSPFLWAHMRQYVEQTAEIFDGIRLDNCHSTPLHVAEYMLDCARNVRPDLYVTAELFTNSDHVDNVFVNRLGITSLIREAMSAWDAHELGRLVHRFGARPVGSFLPADPDPSPDPSTPGVTSPSTPRLLGTPGAPCTARALLLDQTHDNPSPIARCGGSAYGVLPTAALVAAASCATGSSRGLDELVPHQIDVVEEKRLYPSWSKEYETCGVVPAKRALNELHQWLHAEGYSEIYVDDMDSDIVAVTRHNPRTRESVIVVAFTALGAVPEPPPCRRPPPLRFQGNLDELLLEADLQLVPEAGQYERDPSYINGLPQYVSRVSRHVPLARSRVLAGQRRDGDHTALDFHEVAPGAVLVVKVSLDPEARAAIQELQGITSLPLGAPPPGLAAVLSALDLADYNVLLYRCEAEEREDTGGAAGCYHVPGHGALVYAGLAGAEGALRAAAAAGEGALGHAVCANLRAGDWLREYTCARLERPAHGAALRAAGAWLRAALRPLARVPRYLHPALVHAVLTRTAEAARRAALRLLSPPRAPGRPPCPLARALALTSVQLVGRVQSARLPAPAPPRAATLSAGLPHFATGYMRCWGRDTFISLRGLLLLTGRFEDARNHILGFAACLRHGLVPNLLDGGERARYNCRDAVWWWALAVQQYCALAPPPAAAALLAAAVPRLFPTDDAVPGHTAPVEQPLKDVLQEALDTHFQGIVYRERGAGREIDAHMSDRGFTVQVGIDPRTGFVFGGNDANAGTWCDKMGSSDKAGNRGRPATPRDGSAIELVALSYCTARWLDVQHRAGNYPYPGLTRRHPSGAATVWSWEQWAKRIEDNFETHFWIGDKDGANETRPDLVHRRNIYKDSVGASQPWADYQLRPNQLVALALAPALCSPARARRALTAIEQLLLGPLGVKTLDPADWNYCGDYNNSDDSTDPKTAHGFNYHQGPEWVWPLGLYLRARLHFPPDVAAPAAAAVRAKLGQVQEAVNSEPWRALPELTNSGGRYCADSCRSQAWSSATILEVLYELSLTEQAQSLPAAE